jgi:NAD+ diphosphatase
MTVDPFTAPIVIDGMGFAGSPLDRADALRTDSARIDAMKRQAGARFLALQELKPAVDLSTGKARLLWLDGDDVDLAAEMVFLGLQGEIPHFALSVPSNAALPGKVLDARAAAMQMEPHDSAVIGHARAMLSWHQTHKHCAVCGATTTLAKAGYARKCSAEACAADHFPRTDPVVIMLVIDGDRCLLGRQPQFPARFFSALAGFIEPGETMEEAVAREVWEEAGLRTGRVRYVASQPWPFPSSLMIGCFAEATSFDLAIDKTELEDAQWFSRDEVLASIAGAGPFLMPPPMAIAHHLVKAWAKLNT